MNTFNQNNTTTTPAIIPSTPNAYNSNTGGSSGFNYKPNETYTSVGGVNYDNAGEVIKPATAPAVNNQNTQMGGVKTKPIQQSKFVTGITHAPINAKVNTINANNLPTPGGSNFVTPAPVPGPTADGFLSSLKATDMENQNQVNSLQTQQDSDYKNYLDSNEQNKLTENEFKKNKYNEYGYDEDAKKLRENNMLVASYMGRYGEAKAQVANSSVFAGFNEGEQARLDNVAAAKIGSLKAVSEALRGNMALSSNMVDHATELEYAPAKAKLERTLKWFEYNEGKLTGAKAKQAESAKKSYQRELQVVENQENDTKKAREMLTTAAQNGADINTIRKLATTPNLSTMQVVSAGMGEYMKSKFEKEKESLTLEEMRAGINQKNRGDYTMGSDGNIYDKNTGKIMPKGTMVGVVGGYDISSYATDPNHERAVGNIYANLPDFTDVNTIQGAIKNASSTSPITGQMIANASTQYGVDPKMVFAMMMQDSSLGTAGMGAKNNNPGNIAQFDHLNRPVKGYATLQDGVNAVADWLSRKKVSAGQQIGQSQQSGSTSDILSDITNIIKSNSKIGEGQRTQLGDAAKVIAGIDSLNIGEDFAGYGMLAGINPNMFSSADAIKNRSAVSALALQVQKWASGASLSNQQVEQVNNMMPTWYDDTSTIKTKMGQLKAYMSTQIQGTLATNGISYKPTEQKIEEKQANNITEPTQADNDYISTLNLQNK